MRPAHMTKRQKDKKIALLTADGHCKKSFLSLNQHCLTQPVFYPDWINVRHKESNQAKSHITY